MSTAHVPHKPAHWWRVGKRTARKRYPLRWRPGSTPPLVAWAEIRDWGLISIRRTPDNLLECRVVDKTRTVAAVSFAGIATYADATRRLDRLLEDLIQLAQTVPMDSYGERKRHALFGLLADLYAVTCLPEPA